MYRLDGVTKVVIFGLDYFAPAWDRKLSDGELDFNPHRDSHFLIGGGFLEFDRSTGETGAYDDFWIWTTKNQGRHVKSIYDYIKAAVTVPSNLGDDMTVLAGVGIVNTALPILHALFIKHQVAPEAEIFTVMTQFRAVDLALCAIPMFKSNTPWHAYPRTKDELGTKYKFNSFKRVGLSVLKQFDAGRYGEVADRMKAEVHQTAQIYKEHDERPAPDAPSAPALPAPMQEVRGGSGRSYGRTTDGPGEDEAAVERRLMPLESTQLHPSEYGIPDILFCALVMRQ